MNSKLNPKHLKAYKELAGSDESISGENILKFFSELGLEGHEDIIAYLFYLMKASDNSQILPEEFGNLMTATKCDTISDLKKKLPALKKEFENKEVFKNVYWSLFDLFKERKDSKSLPFDVAQSIWETYLPGRFTHFNKFVEYLNSLPEGEKKYVNKDLWRMVLDFEHTTGGDLSKYNEMMGYPVFIDNFVEYAKK